jgi:hypothetical protein
MDEEGTSAEGYRKITPDCSWRVGARFRSTWRKKTGKIIARKRVEET